MELPRKPEDTMPSAAAHAKCEACGEPAGWQVWGVDTCLLCSTNFYERVPTYSVLRAKFGPECNFSEKLADFTQRWLERRRVELGVDKQVQGAA